MLGGVVWGLGVGISPKSRNQSEVAELAYIQSRARSLGTDVVEGPGGSIKLSHGVSRFEHPVRTCQVNLSGNSCGSNLRFIWRVPIRFGKPLWFASSPIRRYTGLPFLCRFASLHLPTCHSSTSHQLLPFASAEPKYLLPCPTSNGFSPNLVYS